MPCYEWLSNHCGYCPQIWLSRSQSDITGYRRHIGDHILFGFDIIKGFPLSYDHWESMLNSIINDKDFNKQNEKIVKSLNEMLEYYAEENEEVDEAYLIDWINSGKDLSVYLNKYVFKEINQVVVPSLNLKVAKKIICSNEKQKKKLRKMGFIEDRITIKNIKSNTY